MKKHYLDNLAEAFLEEIYKEHAQKDPRKLVDIFWNYLQEKRLSPVDMDRVMERVGTLSEVRERGPVVTIMSTYELPQKIKTALEEPLVKTIKKFQTNYIIEPDLIGGVRIQVGDTVYDYSIAHSLQTLRSTLIHSTLL